MGYQITKLYIRKPVTAFLIILSIVFFGFMSITKFKYELMPEISMPMYIVATIQPGGQPEDIDEIITKKFEDEFYNLQGVKNLIASSRENASIIAIQYNYGQNMDKAYNDLKKAIDKVKIDFPDSVKESTIFEMNLTQTASMKLAVKNPKSKDLYNDVKNGISKEIEKLSEVSEVSISGGRENYIKIEVKPEMMMRYGLSMNTLKSIIENADFTLPGGDAYVGGRKLSVSSSVKYDTVESFRQIPIITGNMRTLYLEDLADVGMAEKDIQELGRYDGEDCIILSITKTTSGSTLALSEGVKKVIEDAKNNDKNLEVTIVNDSSDNIKNSIHNVFETMVIAIVLSMFVIWLFLGDIKASIIVGTSIPFSIFTSFTCMYLSGYTLNVVTLSALVLGVGMMVDNSIVVLEACFRASDEFKGKNTITCYCEAVLNASKTIGFSVFGSTLTTVVVFAPLGFLNGLTGQFFKPLGFTIVYCMIASYFSALSVVPLLYVLLRPTEKEKSLAGGIVSSIQELYRKVMPNVIKHRWVSIIISIVLLIGAFSLLSTFKTELVAKSDNGMIKIDIVTKPGLSIESKDKIYKKFEEFVSKDDKVEHYVLSNSASSTSLTSTDDAQSIIAFLCDKKGRTETTNQIVSRWKNELADMTNATFEITSYSTAATSQFAVLSDDKYEIYLQADSYKTIKNVNDKIVKQLEERKDCTNITSTLDNAAPIIKAEIDPILAAAEGFTPILVGSYLHNMLSGLEVMDKNIDNNTYKVIIEYPKDEYDTIEKIRNIQFVSDSGHQIMLDDMSKIDFHDSPAAIPKFNKKYRTTITVFFNEFATKNTKKEIEKDIVEPYIGKNVEKGQSTVDEILNEEFAQLYLAIFVATFLVFVVMASQFESGRFSLMVMGTIIFSFAGGIFALWIANLRLSMVVLLGMLMLIGTAVNNGILYVDTVNQFLNDGKDVLYALVESGAIRLRPILMTTLTTIVSMIPMSLAYGNNGEVLQGLAVVDIGGLIVSTLMALFILPCFYYVFSKTHETLLERLRPVAQDAVVAAEIKMHNRDIENLERRAKERNE